MKVHGLQIRSLFLNTVAALGISATALFLFYMTCQPGSLTDSDCTIFRRAKHKQAEAPCLPQINLIPKLSEKKTILLMGVDSNGKDADRFQGTRSDTMMLVSIDPAENKVGVVSIPRDSRVKIPGHGNDKINSAHALGGPELSIRTINEAFGVPVDHYIEVDTQGLKKLFEILGPVEVLVEKEMHYTDHTAKLHVNLKPGLQTLTAAQAEEYVRFRHDARGDIGRIERQQWFIRQAAKKFQEPQIILKMPELVALAYECVRTDIPLQDVLRIAAFAKDFPREKVVTAMLPGSGQTISGGSYWIPDPLASQAVLSRILNCPTSFSSAAAPPTEYESPICQDSIIPSAVAAAPPGLTYDDTKPLTVCIKYPPGAEQLAEELSQKLTDAGVKVKYRWQVPASECQHELLIQQSVRADDRSTAQLAAVVPELESFPVSLAIETRPISDVSIVISTDSRMPSVVHPTPMAVQKHNPPLQAFRSSAPLAEDDVN